MSSGGGGGIADHSTDGPRSFQKWKKEKQDVKRKLKEKVKCEIGFNLFVIQFLLAK